MILAICIPSDNKFFRINMEIYSELSHFRYTWGPSIITFLICFRICDSFSKENKINQTTPPKKPQKIKQKKQNKRTPQNISYIRRCLFK